MIAIDEHVVRLLNVTGRKGDLKATWRIITVYHVRDGKQSRAGVHFDPQVGADALATHVARTLRETVLPLDAGYGRCTVGAKTLSAA